MSALELGGAAYIGLAAVGGGTGAALRFAVDRAVTRRWRRDLPLGTLLINVTGSVLLGILVGAASGPTVLGPSVLGPAALALLGTGVLGGYTTFSTASVEAVQLARSGRGGSALAYALGSMVITVVAALAGLFLGGLWMAG